jgi:DNA repair exonuclease SbcCD ATPase subunit
LKHQKEKGRKDAVMAGIREFVDELTASMDVLNKGIAQVRETVAENKARAEVLQKAREQRIIELSQSLLPDLQTATIQKLAARLPEFADSNTIAAALSAENATIQTQIDRLKGRFEPATYDQRKARYESGIGKEQDDLSLLRPTFDDLFAINDLVRLIADGYGTSAYSVSWFWHPIQYFGDWKAADKAVQTAKQKDWNTLRQAYLSAKNDVDSSKEKIAGLRDQMAQLEDARRQYDELQAALKAVPQVMLERLQTKLKARLACLEPVPFWMQDVAVLNGKINEALSPNAKLQDTLGKMSDDLASLQKLKINASKSRKREVPDSYVQQLRTNRTAHGSFTGGGFSSPTFVSYYDGSNGFLEGLVIGEILASNDRGNYAHDGGYRNDEYRSFDRSVET